MLDLLQVMKKKEAGKRLLYDCERLNSGRAKQRRGSFIPPSLLLGRRAGGDLLPVLHRAPSACPQAPAICGPVVPVTSAPMETDDYCSIFTLKTSPDF